MGKISWYLITKSSKPRRHRRTDYMNNSWSQLHCISKIRWFNAALLLSIPYNQQSELQKMEKITNLMRYLPKLPSWHSNGKWGIYLTKKAVCGFVYWYLRARICIKSSEGCNYICISYEYVYMHQVVSSSKSQHKATYKWGLFWQKQVSQAGISNYIPHKTVGCNYLSLPEIPASGKKILKWSMIRS